MNNVLQRFKATRRDFIKQMGFLGMGSLLLTPMSALALAKPAVKGKALPQIEPDKQQVVDALTAKTFPNLDGGVTGLSDNQIKQHLGLYQNYVNKTNALNAQIKALDEKTLSESTAAYGQLRELTVELSFSHNGVALHELYFANLGASGSTPSNSLVTLINRDFGSWDNFLKHFMAVGKSMRGWAVLAFDMLDGKLRFFGLDQHHEWCPVHAYPLLVLDVYEHAYMIDFGTARAKYLDLFVQHIDWAAVDKRLMFAVHHLMSGPQATA